MFKTLANAVLLLPVFAIVLAKTLFATVTAPFTSTSPTYTVHIINAAVRALLGDLSPAQLQLLLPAFLETYKSHCKSSKLVPNIVPIPNTNSQGFWLGSPQNTKYHMLYIHGGGYVLPASAAHIAMLEKFIRWSNNNLAIFCVDYTLSPEAIYPTAFSQCVEGIRYVLSLPNTSTSTTVLAGDSAGAALILGMLSHVSLHAHPNSEIVRPLILTQDFRGAILIDPFISSDNKQYPSLNLFANRDTFNKSTADRWLATYKGNPNISNDDYITPAHAPSTWWTGTRCGSILVTVGEEESLRDAVIDWAGKYRVGMGESEEAVRLVIGKKETHLHTILAPYSEEQLNEMGEKAQEGALRKYVVETLGT